MSTDQRNNGNATPPSTPHGNKDVEKNPEMEEQEQVKQRKPEALMQILNIEEKKANEKLERIRREKQRAGALSRSEVSDETNNKSTSEEDVYQAPPEKDRGRKRRWAEKKREKTGKGKQLGHPEKWRRTEKALPETEDPEVRRLDEANAWVEGESSCQLCTQVGVQCLWPPANSRKKACRYCRLRKVKCSHLLENENCQPTTWWTELRTLRAGGSRGVACHAIGQNSDGDSESSSSSSESSSEDEEDEEVEHVKTDVEMGGPSTEMVPPAETVHGPPMFGPFATTSDGTVFHVNMDSTTVVVKTEENAIPRDNEEDLAHQAWLRKKNKLNTKAKAKEAEKTV
ncbi:hypothetical protein C8R45DRAFT_1089403 [Mycena sanguinolenta]|nr:hypothetical protein C8R45DRAFT_1089403 [Mycena sanguinolenta]